MKPFESFCAAAVASLLMLRFVVTNTWNRPLKYTYIDYSEDKCLDDDLHIVDLYVSQLEPTKQYINKCSYAFLELCKQKNTDDMLILGSIFERDNLSIPVSLKLIDQMPFPSNGVIQYRVVVRFENGYPNETTLRVTINDRVFPLKLSPSDLVLEYMLPELTYFSTDSLPELSVPSNQAQYINTSYMMVCLNGDYPNVFCEFVVSGTRVACYCTLDENGYVLVSIEFVAIWALFAVILIYYTTWKHGPREPEMQLNMVLCLPGQSQYEYLVVFRVGLATDGFNYNTNYIDLQLLCGNEEPIGQPIRYSCANLPDQMCAEMHMLVGRVSPMPLITGVRANHADSHNLLHFQDFAVINLRGVYSLMQEDTIDQFITSEPLVFRPLPKPNCQKKENKSTSAVKPASNAQVVASKKRSWLPLVSAGGVHVTEKLAICMLVLGFIGLCIMQARIHLHSYQYWKDFGRSMIQFVVCMLAVSGLSWLIIVLLELFYTGCIGRHYLAETYRQATANQGPSYFRVIRILYLLVLHIIGIAFSAYTISLSHHNKLDYISAFIWSGISFCTIVLTIGLWLVLDEFIIQSLKTARAQQDFVQLLQTDRLSPSLARQPLSDPSTLFKFALSSGASKPVLSTTSSNIGPKLINPNLIPKKNKSSATPKQTSSSKVQTDSIKSKSISKSKSKKRAKNSEGTLSSAQKLDPQTSKGSRKTRAQLMEISSVKNLPQSSQASKLVASSKLKNSKVKVSRLEQQTSTSLQKRQ